MLKKLAFGGAVLAAFAGVGLAAPAHATIGPDDGGNVARQSDNIVVCGNQAIGDIIIPVIPLTPVTIATRKPVDCSIRAYQNNN
ncbi:hypothetical protein DP939_29440 [Spongiactinospora rosea]|uniref:Chaplin domain-containing protein n=2 Tax=Spongiactinospora TaxID=2871671 RepID=A0A2W2HZY6_9ACTN|nr:MULTISPECIES: hypothetical protein [Spongiactinospora]PZG56250.1 hypothetical protein C1I98_01675 [Spongiactinospora gelatinilytica]RBQ16452.1 hypothetical protein DP939_29440 [Spongiactinospora rosea]